MCCCCVSVVAFNSLTAASRTPVSLSYATAFVLPDLTALVDSQRQTDPPFRTPRLSTRRSAAAVRRQLIAQKGSTDDALPTVPTLTTNLHALGYYPKKVAPSPPQNKSQKPMPSARR